MSARGWAERLAELRRALAVEPSGQVSPETAAELEQLREQNESYRIQLNELSREYERLEVQLAEQAKFLESVGPEIDRLNARIAELEAITANARKLSSGWKQASGEHHQISHMDTIKETPLLAGIQQGRADQYSDCANELDDVLAGEDPDSWTYGVSIEAGESRG